MRNGGGERAAVEQRIWSGPPAIGGEFSKFVEHHCPHVCLLSPPLSLSRAL